MARSKTESQLAEAYRWAIREGKKVGPTAALVLAEILTFADLVTGFAYPKRDTIASDLYDTDEPTKAQLNQISDCISGLERAGLLERQQMVDDGYRTVNLYRLHVGTKAATAPRSSGRGRPGFTGHGAPTRSVHGEPGNTGHQEVSSEVSNELSNRRRGRHLKAVK